MGKRTYAVYSCKGKEKLRDIVNGEYSVSRIIQIREKQGYKFEAIKKVVY